jgi:hypothetical protein
MLGGVVGGLAGWLLCGQLYRWNTISDPDRMYDRWKWLNKPFPKGFWRSSGYFALTGAVVGLVIAALKLIL